MIAHALDLLLLLCLFTAPAQSQSTQDPLRYFCRRYGHQTTVLDRKLYIDGGWLYTGGSIDQSSQPITNQGLTYGDLNYTKGDMPTINTTLSKNSIVPSVAGGILWPDEINKVFWLYGGEYASDPSAFQLWGYDTLLDQWNTSTAEISPPSSIRRAAHGAGTTIGGKGYYYGGYLSNKTDPSWDGPPLATSGMIVLDMYENTLRNISGPPDNIARAEGVMLSIPASKKGLLVYFGGVSYPCCNYSEVPMSMTEIMLYDAGDNSWHTQTATGDIPPSRRKFCAGAAWAEDQSSYNIYLYGGFGFGENSTGFDDVYILTLPAFKWIKWFPLSTIVARPHGDLSCNVIGNGQMIIMGGNFSGSDAACDVPDVGGQHNLNLYDKWNDYLPNITSYSVPDDVSSAVGGSPEGGATELSPADGFRDSALSVYFAAGQSASFDPRSPTRYIPLATQTSQSSSKPPIGAIAGGAVGGLIVLILVALAVWWFCLRRPKPDRTSQVSQPHLTGVATELSGDHQQDYNKLANVTRVPGSPEYSLTQAHSPSYGHPPVLQPQHPMVYQNLPPNPQQYYEIQQQGYVYPQYPAGNVAPQGHYPQAYQQQQQYFPPPEISRLSPPVPHEMPTSRTPGFHQIVHQPVPQRADFTNSVSSRSYQKSM